MPSDRREGPISQLLNRDTSRAHSRFWARSPVSPLSVAPDKGLSVEWYKQSRDPHLNRTGRHPTTFEWATPDYLSALQR